MEDDPALPDPINPNSFGEKWKEYERTIEELFNKLAESQHDFNELAESQHERKTSMEELLSKLAESEEDRKVANDRRMQAEQRRRLAEVDLRASIEKALRFERMYYEEWTKRKSVEEELASCKEEMVKKSMASSRMI